LSLFMPRTVFKETGGSIGLFSSVPVVYLDDAAWSPTASIKRSSDDGPAGPALAPLVGPALEDPKPPAP
ncbi:hypothetical protein KM043_018868, partial [Ampulex compressa]